jgi:hypothetical protein
MHTAELEEADLDFVIDVNQEWQCRWWSYGLRVTPDELRAAVREVGSSANDVRDYLMSGTAPRNAAGAATGGQLSASP